MQYLYCFFKHQGFSWNDYYKWINITVHFVKENQIEVPTTNAFLFGKMQMNNCTHVQQSVQGQHCYGYPLVKELLYTSDDTSLIFCVDF